MSWSHRRVSLAVIAVALFLAPRPVRGQDVSGTWTTEVPVRVSNEGGSETVEETALATLTLVQEGTVVRGTWQMAPTAERPAPPVRALHGALRDGKVILTDTVEAMVRRGDEMPLAVEMVSTLELTLEGDNLNGYQSARSLDGSISSPSRPLTLARLRS